MSNVIDLNRVRETRPTTKPKQSTEEYDFNEVIERNKRRDRMVNDERKQNNKATKRRYLRRDD